MGHDLGLWCCHPWYMEYNVSQQACTSEGNKRIRQHDSYMPAGCHFYPGTELGSYPWTSLFSVQKNPERLHCPDIHFKSCSIGSTDSRSPFKLCDYSCIDNQRMDRRGWRFCINGILYEYFHFYGDG